ncbi:hypothetical protein GQ42DRAFT_37913 [Ramicandelaber brevisporus]|nr:hypothetical protein GQ42DRAFT_37913 [Ramicandelaber brevisporus]
MRCCAHQPRSQPYTSCVDCHRWHRIQQRWCRMHCLRSMAEAVGSTSVLGYCAFRRDAPLHPSIRDKDMMNAIARRLYSSSIPLSQPMVFALFTSRYTSEELSTLEWSYAMWWCIYNSTDGNIGQMEPAFIHIDTMTSSSNRVTEYATMTSASPSVERIDLNASRDQVHGVDISSMMQQTARDTINNSDKLFDDIMGKIEDASKELARTEIDLQRLRAERDVLLANIQ